MRNLAGTGPTTARRKTDVRILGVDPAPDHHAAPCPDRAVGPARRGRAERRRGCPLIRRGVVTAAAVEVEEWVDALGSSTPDHHLPPRPDRTVISAGHGSVGRGR